MSDISKINPVAASQADTQAEEKRRIKTIEQLLKDDGELTEIEQEVLQSIKEQELLSSSMDVEDEPTMPFGDRIADKVAAFGGSWKFIITFFVILFGWIIINSIVLLQATPFDPYPFILLNLILSCIAAIQAPIIMMSQNRQETKDRKRAEHDYKVNLKAELEVRLLHEKMDYLLTKQWQRLMELQKLQMDMLDKISQAKDKQE